MEVLRDECHIRSVIWSPECTCTRCWIPIHLTDTLEEDREVEAEPVEAEIYTILITWLFVTDDSAVTRFVYSVVTYVDLVVTVEVNILEVTGSETLLSSC